MWTKIEKWCIRYHPSNFHLSHDRRHQCPQQKLQKKMGLQWIQSVASLFSLNETLRFIFVLTSVSFAFLSHIENKKTPSPLLPSCTHFTLPHLSLLFSRPALALWASFISAIVHDVYVRLKGTGWKRPGAGRVHIKCSWPACSHPSSSFATVLPHLWAELFIHTEPPAAALTLNSSSSEVQCSLRTQTHVARFGKTFFKN